MRIIQVLDNLAFGDAVGNHTVGIRKILTDWKCETQIYSRIVDKRYPASMRKPIDQLSVYPDDILIYHFCNSSELNLRLKTWKCKKILVFHNITPACFFQKYDPQRASLQNIALSHIRQLKDDVDIVIAMSTFSKNDLIKLGFAPHKIVIMPSYVIPFDDYKMAPAQNIIKKYCDGYTNIVFVGRLAPNKGHADMIRSFAYYFEHINNHSRLLLVGSNFSTFYTEELKTYAQSLGLLENIIFTGSVPFADLIAYYKIADVFLCMSEHEGFCVPLVEAMFFQVPIMAYDACAVAETLGDAGILLKDKDPIQCAYWIDRLLNDQELKSVLLAAQKRMLNRYLPKSTIRWFDSFITRVAGLPYLASDYFQNRATEKKQALTSRVYLNFLELKNDEAKISGVLFSYLPFPNENLQIIVNNKSTEYVFKQRKDKVPVKAGCRGYPIGFEFKLPLLQSDQRYQITFTLQGYPLKVSYTMFMPITNLLTTSCYTMGHWTAHGTSDTLFLDYAEQVCNKSTIRSEVIKLKEVCTRAPKVFKEVLCVRLAAILLKKFKRKEIWLFSDRALKANDNGECFLDYVLEQKRKNIRPFFLLDHQSEDYPRIRKKCKVIPYLSLRHKILFLACDYLISSNCLRSDLNPFLDNDIYFRDLKCGVKFIYLDHGIKKDDLASNISKYAINADLLVCSSRQEQIELQKPYYGYTARQVILTGLARYDYLYNQPQRRIALMPTFREFLFNGVDYKTGHFLLKPNFKNSDYFKFYSALITNPQLVEILSEYDYVIDFVMHPAFYPYKTIFDCLDTKRVVFHGEEVVHRDVYAKASVLITDYSSTTFDFAYLKKPQVYCQFDKDIYYGVSGHRGKGYFDFERDGFGPVTYNLDETVDSLIKIIRSGCMLDNFYDQRIRKFFAFSDRENRKRIYQEIQRIEMS